MLIKIDQTCIAKHVWGIVFLSKLKCRCSQFLPAHGARRSMFSSKPFKRLALLFGKQAPCSLHLLLQLVHVIIRLIVTNLTFRADCDWLFFFWQSSRSWVRETHLHTSLGCFAHNIPQLQKSQSWKQYWLHIVKFYVVNLWINHVPVSPGTGCSQVSCAMFRPQRSLPKSRSEPRPLLGIDKTWCQTWGYPKLFMKNNENGVYPENSLFMFV